MIMQCSIDSLLERTIKHMIFMQSITKHAEKLNKCTGSKVSLQYGASEQRNKYQLISVVSTLVIFLTILNCCFKLLEQDPRGRGASVAEQGSSWAVEVGTNSKVCPIVVENINMNGQMLVEVKLWHCDFCCSDILAFE